MLYNNLYWGIIVHISGVRKERIINFIHSWLLFEVIEIKFPGQLLLCHELICLGSFVEWWEIKQAKELRNEAKIMNSFCVFTIASFVGAANPFSPRSQLLYHRLLIIWLFFSIIQVLNSFFFLLCCCFLLALYATFSILKCNQKCCIFR